MRYCDEEAITFDLAISQEKKETIAEKMRQRGQRYFEVLYKNLFTQKVQRVERVQRIKKVEKNCCLQSVELGT